MQMGMYDDRESAERAVDRLHALGYSRDDISVMMHDKTRAKEFGEKTGSHAAEGAISGAAIGGGLGAIVAALTATGSVAAIVGTGGAAAPIVAGPLAAALAGLGAGGAAGGIVGGLIGAGIPEHKAKQYESRLNDGGILLGVTPKANSRDDVQRVFDDQYTESAGRMS